MKVNSSDNTDARWQKTPVANLVRHVRSGSHYARIRVRGKLIWKSLNTDRISVAKLRLGDFLKGERQRAAAQTAVSRGRPWAGVGKHGLGAGFLDHRSFTFSFSPGRLPQHQNGNQNAQDLFDQACGYIRQYYCVSD